MPKQANDNTENMIRIGFSNAVDKGDANALATWAPKVIDWEAARTTPRELWECPYPERVPTLAECMVDAMNCSPSCPLKTQAMQLILNATSSSDTDLAMMAGELMERMGAAFARTSTRNTTI